MAETVVQKCSSQATYDFETAKSMLEAGRYLYVLFCCQQAIEKMLKALITAKTNSFPPRLHQLNRLAEVAGIELADSRSELFRELSNFYIQTRCPEEFENTGAEVDRELAQQHCSNVEEI